MALVTETDAIEGRLTVPEDYSHAAHAALLMARAHEPHQPNRQNQELWCCKGILDPISGEWCQFQGTAKEQFRHQRERVSAALRAELSDNPDQPREPPC